MSWRTTCPVNELACFMHHLKTGLLQGRRTCDRCGVNRKTARNWIGRDQDCGLPALVDQPRVTSSCRHRMPDDLAPALLACRDAHPTRGPRQRLACLTRRRPNAPWPASSTVGDPLKRENKIEPRRRRSRLAHPGRLSTSPPDREVPQEAELQRPSPKRPARRQWRMPHVKGSNLTQHVLRSQSTVMLLLTFFGLSGCTPWSFTPSLSSSDIFFRHIRSARRCSTRIEENVVAIRSPVRGSGISNPR